MILKSFQGLEKNIENKIIEIVRTNDLEKLKKLRERYPQGILNILNISGLGIKKDKNPTQRVRHKNTQTTLGLCKRRENKTSTWFWRENGKKRF